MTTEGQQPRLDPALRGRLIASFKFRDDGLVDISQTLDALIDSIAPAAQPQIDREIVWVEVDGRIHDASLIEYKDEYTIWPVYRIAHLNAAPAAQPVPTRGQIVAAMTDPDGSPWDLEDAHIIANCLIAAGLSREDSNTCPRCKGTGHVYIAMAADVVPHKNCPVCKGSGLVRENEPEPQVGEVELNNQHNRGFDLGWRAAYAEVARYATEVVDDWDSEPYVLAKAVAERGGS